MTEIGRMPRIVNFTVTSANTWYKAFDESDYKNNRIREVKVKLREDSTADHFRYAYKADSVSGGVITIATYLTSTSGFFVVKNLKKLYVYVPTTAAQVIEMEVIYQ